VGAYRELYGEQSIQAAETGILLANLHLMFGR
jgi:hypothetical protein